ncbi:hypothetical protein M885DRAFT_520957 [Pelagophyceae sp. CCMP2097]|nr:hypothetical protein M885DRAFT_520957 [Pelagophyceae sp. CCMP2097]|mmetsp:Transcript_6100/g.19539  ORF Transcript_6100/g.19539 Transcript_6100/m.19539 type:complete len:374 (-) Transcript_6100:23-1144(-)
MEFSVVFTERRLGLKLVLARVAGRERVVVEETLRCDARILPTDELVSIDGIPVGAVTADAFAAFTAALGRRNRPLQLTFSPGADRDVALQAQLLAQAKSTSAAALGRYEKRDDDGKAAFNAAMLRANGAGGKDADRVAALQLLRKAASLGVVRAQAQLGSLYATGRGGVKRDDEEAMRWFTAAAQTGDAESLYALGTLCHLGLGTQQDDAAALWHWTKAANMGHHKAQDKARELVAANDAAARRRAFAQSIWDAVVGKHERPDYSELLTPMTGIDPTESALFGGEARPGPDAPYDPPAFQQPAATPTSVDLKAGPTPRRDDVHPGRAAPYDPPVFHRPAGTPGRVDLEAGLTPRRIGSGVPSDDGATANPFHD